MVKFKKFLSTLMAACLVLSLLPATSHAVDTSTLHNCNVPEGYHLFTTLPTAEDPVTTETIYWGNALDGVFYGMNSTFTAASGNSSVTTATDAAKMNTITIHYGGNDATYGDYYYLVFTLSSGTSYAVAYSSGYYSQNTIQNTGLPSGGWADKHKFFYNADEHVFFHRPSNSMTTMKAPQISTTSQKIFTNYQLSVVLGDGKYPVRMYEPCASDNVKGSNATHQWSGTCSCGYQFDYEEKGTEEVVNIAVPAGYHQFDISKLPKKAGESVSNLYLGAAFEANGAFYGMSSTASGNAYPTATSMADQCTITIHYGGVDETYGDYYYVEFTLPSGVSYALTYASGVFSQNKLTDGLPSGSWAAKHKMFFDETYQLFYHRPSNDMTVMKGLKLSNESQKLFTEKVENLQTETDAYVPARLFEACTSDNTAGQDDTHHWSGTCTCGHKFDYEPNYVLQTRAPQASTAFYWGVTQQDMEGQPTYFFNGNQLTSSYDTQLDMLSATAVYVDVVAGGYNLYFLDAEDAKQYICLGKDASNSYKTYIDIVTDAAAATVFTWNADYNTFVTTVVKDAAGNTVDMVLGTYTSGSTAYSKISGLLLSHLAQAHYFAAQLYVEHMTHTYDGWGYDDQNHWKTCFCGKKEASEAHTFGEPVVEDGKICKKCICGYAELEGTVPYVESHAISMADSFAIRFVVKSEQFRDGAYKEPYMVFGMNGEETIVAEYETQDEYYVFTFRGLAPDLMGETVTANLYATVAQETVLVSTDTYSVAQYCYDALRNEASGDALRRLLVETLNFGAAAQKYRDSNISAEELVNANLTDAEKALGYTGELRALTSCKSVGTNNGSVKWYGASLLMGDTIKLRVYFEAEDITGLSVKANDEIATSIEPKDGKYYVDFAQVNPTQMNEEITVIAYKSEEAVSSTMCYSFESYAAAWLGRSNASDAQKELVTAMIRYGDAAKAYAERTYDLQEDVLYLGRTYTMNGAQWFNWSASGFSVRFQGSGLTAKIASNAPDATNYAYLKVYVDGAEQEDILLDETLQTVTLAQDLDPEKTHTVEVRKRNSPRSSTAGLLNMELLDGQKLAPAEKKDKLIEFVGDSLTVGYSAADANKTESGWSTKTEDGTKTYSKQVADAFGAEYMVTAISGRGVVMNNNNADGYKFPEIYPELDIYNNPGTAYDFAQQPDVIVINLGTNDATNSNLDLTVFQTGVVNFIKTVRAKNPNAEIIWAYGLRTDKMTKEVDAAIQAAVAQVNQAGDSNVYYLALPVAADMHLSHPTAAAYGPSGEKLIEKIAEITGWQQ